MEKIFKIYITLSLALVTGAVAQNHYADNSGDGAQRSTIYLMPNVYPAVSSMYGT